MHLELIDYYLIGMNATGFVLYIINMWLYSHTEEGQIDRILTVASILGGSLGIVIAILLFDRKPVKDNMMSRVFVSCVLVIQIVVVLIFKGFIKNEITWTFWLLFDQNKFAVIYLLFINVLTLIMFAIDKIAAIEHRSRIRIVTLLGLSFIGGSIGALIAMYVFHHKTKQDYFSVGIPLIVFMQLCLMFFLLNAKL